MICGRCPVKPMDFAEFPLVTKIKTTTNTSFLLFRLVTIKSTPKIAEYWISMCYPHYWSFTSWNLIYCISEATVKPIFKQNGDSLDLSCNSTGTIQWRKDGDDPVTRGVQSSSSDGKWSSSLMRENISSVDGGDYECYTVSTEKTSINQFSVHIISCE